MNILFVLYGGFETNSAIPLALHSRELERAGHQCAVAMPSLGDAPAPSLPAPRAITYAQALESPQGVFDNGRAADVLHAWTPREGVRRFVTHYLTRTPTPWIAYLEDNETWLARTALAAAAIPADRLLEHTDEVITTWTPEGMPHPLRYRAFVALADAAVVIQDKLRVDVAPWVPCATVMPGVDLQRFAPRPPDPALRERIGVKAGERVIVYPGGLNDFTRPGLEALCRAVGIVNARGVPCRLLRSGPVPLDFLGRLPAEAASAVTDVGALPREDIPGLLALADAFVQPGKHDPFEDLRLPGKLPELFATGRPVVLPDTNIAYLLHDGVDAVLHRTGTPAEIAEKCLELFADGERGRRIGEAGRRFAEEHFDPRIQAQRLLGVYEAAHRSFDRNAAADLWDAAAIEAPVPLLVAKRLRMLARSRSAAMDSGALMTDYAQAIEAAFERARGLQKGMAVRDEHIAAIEAENSRLAGDLARLVVERERLHIELQQAQVALSQRDSHIAALESSLSWRITRPLRMALDALMRLARLPR